MAEDLTDYYQDMGVKVRYLHSEIETFERVEIITNLRRGEFDVLVGINLMREGLDVPEVAPVAILDADQEGFLRSGTSLLQTSGRAARNEKGRVIFYADKITNSMQKTLDETTRKRALQEAYNKEHGIVPISIHKEVKDILIRVNETENDRYTEKLIREIKSEVDFDSYNKQDKKKELQNVLKTAMLDAAANLEFEKAAILRDKIAELDRRKTSKQKSQRK